MTGCTLDASIYLICSALDVQKGQRHERGGFSTSPALS